MKRFLVGAGIAVWLIGVIVAFGLVWSYKTTPGERGAAPMHWPAESSIVPAAGKSNLIVFAHPQCPCTRATMAELARIGAELGDRAQIHIVLVRPAGTAPGFEEGTIAERAAELRGARVTVDDGREAALFGSVTSGATVLYTSDGTLGFAGGLTTARGHEGRGPAHVRIADVVHRDRAGGNFLTPIFGCELDQKLTLATKP